MIELLEKVIGCKIFKDERTTEYLTASLMKDLDNTLSWFRGIAAFRVFENSVGVVAIATFGKGRIYTAKDIREYAYLTGPY
jgi:hypothetical protein